MTKPIIFEYGDREKGVFEANCGIVGLGPREDGERWWPTEGYDGPLYEGDSYIAETKNYRPDSDAFAISGHPREEWLALGATMIERWRAWMDHVMSLPDDPPLLLPVKEL